ncbi:MAG TPA: OB-fold nucleic acid binding domain-containing protein [Pyrinomonadaceae bacterium]|nr:OB-fold nucleic acid binding domain-containing protein [Chloracidobacterium sp.]MBP9934399.1 OB-fold nucleic acid binding domain-containing protein [Pyrinomonadaceae bacterium]MBK9766207.1 OB-fold nucleic acid binding domain-containing protein [Chloracidobacterium sp.]MBL0240142.1 OB-fold nucleic acid binding domain-containing protein [Chloracidobacterium sp.]HQY67386.1 OB-fold nucleic acid binding domain-containing protein [Pyrinomonadaceae bacterium]
MITTKAILFLIWIAMVTLSGSAQTGGTFGIEKSVISSGGGKADGGLYTVTSTTGQSAVGTNPTGNTFSVRSGFWQSDLAPSAAMVIVKGRIVNSDQAGISLVQLYLTDGGGIVRVSRTNALGYFQFDDVEVGAIYVVVLTHKTYLFSPQIVAVMGDGIDLIFSPQSQ